MSNYEGEAGEWVLPAAAVPAMKKELREVHNAVAEAAYKAAKDWWKANSTQSQAKYDAAVTAYEDKAFAPQRASGYGYGGFRQAVDPRQAAIRDATLEVIRRIGWHARSGGGSLHGATWDDMAAVGWAKKTNRDTVFDDRHGEATIRINDKTRTLSWHVDNNNHAVERAREGLLARTLFARLGKINWTRGTGGTVRYESEYHEDEYGLSAGSTLREWHGPLGAERYKWETGFWPQGSPQAKAEAEKQQKAARAKAIREQQKKQAAAAQKAVAGSQFCGAVKADRSGLCGRKLNGGKCPDHGTTKAGQRIVVTAAGTVAPAVVTADPMR